MSDTETWAVFNAAGEVVRLISLSPGASVKPLAHGTYKSSRPVTLHDWRDWPMPAPPPYPADDEARATPLCGTPDPFTPPPDVWEFYMRHGRWPEPDEA